MKIVIHTKNLMTDSIGRATKEEDSFDYHDVASNIDADQIYLEGINYLISMSSGDAEEIIAKLKERGLEELSGVVRLAQINNSAIENKIKIDSIKEKINRLLEGI